MPGEVPTAPLPAAPAAPEVAPPSAPPADVSAPAAVPDAADVTPAANTPAAPETPAVEDTAPPPELWGEEQWTAWDGTKDTLDDRYHTIYDRMQSQHDSAISNYEKKLAEAQESIRMLAWDEADPHAGKELAEAQSALTAAERRAVEAERALEEYRAEQESTAAEREEAEVTKFKTDHAWLYEEGASGDVKAAVSDLIQRGMLPTRAGDVFKGVDPKEQAVMAESIRRGDSVDTARELARLKTAAPTKPALPKPPPGEEFISGTEPAGRTERRKRAPNEASSARETRYMMAEHMTAA